MSAHATLVADPLAQLAHALLTCISLGGHVQRFSRAPARARAAASPRQPATERAREPAASAVRGPARHCTLAVGLAPRYAGARRRSRREAVVASYGDHHQTPGARRVPGDQLFLGRTRGEPGLAERAAEPARRPRRPTEAPGDGRSRQVVVEPDHARVQLARDAGAPVAVGRPHRRAEAVVARVGTRDRLVLGVDGVDAQDRAVDRLVFEPRIRRDAAQHGGRVERPRGGERTFHGPAAVKPRARRQQASSATESRARAAPRTRAARPACGRRRGRRPAAARRPRPGPRSVPEPVPRGLVGAAERLRSATPLRTTARGSVGSRPRQS